MFKILRSIFTTMKCCIFLLLVIAGIDTLAQDQIFTDRPNVTDAVILLPAGTFQAEVGFLRQINESGDVVTSSYPNFSIKYGIYDWLEMRVLSHYQKTDISLDGVDVVQEGFTPLTISPKIHILKPKGILPRISLVTSLALPELASSDFENEDINYGYRVLTEYTFNTLSWASGIGTDWTDNSESAWSYSSALSTPISKKIGVFGELYGNFGKDLDTSIAFDTGLLYLVYDNLQIDISFGFGLNEAADDGFIGLGVAWRTAL